MTRASKGGVNCVEDIKSGVYSRDFLLDEGRRNHGIIAHDPSIFCSVVHRIVHAIRVKHLKPVSIKSPDGEGRLQEPSSFQINRCPRVKWVPIERPEDPVRLCFFPAA
jgi:hypothetical protein